MPGLRDLPGDQPITAYFPGHLTAATAKESALGRAPFAAVVTAVEFIPAAAIVGAVTNNFTINVRNRGAAGVGANVIATLNFTNGVNGTAQMPVTITLGSGASIVLAEGDVLTCEKAIVGTGLACPDGEIVVHLKGY